MTRLNNLYNGVNLAQGFPDFDPPGELLDAAAKALREGYNQYAITWGAPRLRQPVAEKFGWYNGVNVDPDLHVPLPCGAPEPTMAPLLAIIDPASQLFTFQPFS